MLTEPNILQEQISQQIERRGSRGRPGSWPLRHWTGIAVSVAAPTASGVPNAAAGASAAACGGCPRCRSSPLARGQMDLTCVRNEIQILKKSRIAIFGYPRRDPISDLPECAPEQSNQISNEPSKKKDLPISERIV